MDGSIYFKSLLVRYMNGLASEEEVNDLFEEWSRGKDTEDWEEMIREITVSAEADPAYDKTGFQPLIERIFTAAQTPQLSVRRIESSKRYRWAAAAAVVLLFSTGYFLFYKSGKDQSAIIQHQVKTDVQPGTNKAILTLGNGSKIIIDNTQNGSIAQQGQTRIIKTDSGRLAYLTANEKPAEVLYNTLSTPRGGQFQLILPDRTRVWLNAASSITYPTAFAGKDRKVSITGEVYFEVAHNPSKPFIVKVATQEILVLGTHFNVNAYPDENVVKTTLLQGSVKVTSLKTDQSLIISPGQQTDLNDEQLSLIQNVNLDEIMAWKEGSFYFESADLKTILRQFSRWYDVEVVYESPLPEEKYFAIINRNRSLSKVLNALRTSNIQFSIQNRKLIVKQK